MINKILAYRINLPQFMEFFLQIVVFTVFSKYSIEFGSENIIRQTNIVTSLSANQFAGNLGSLPIRIKR